MERFENELLGCAVVTNELLSREQIPWLKSEKQKRLRSRSRERRSLKKVVHPQVEKAASTA
jgi:hypothetical protein